VNVTDCVPFMIFMAVSCTYMAKEISKLETRDMSAEEAQLYVQVFRHHGFSPSEFSHLLHQAGASWEDVPCDLVLDANSLTRLTFIVRGGCEVHDGANVRSDTSIPVMTLGAGGVIGETNFLRDCNTMSTGQCKCDCGGAEAELEQEKIVVKMGTRLLSWDAKRLCSFMALNEACRHKMHAVLAEGAASKLLLASQRSTGVDGAVPSALTARQHLVASAQRLKKGEKGAARVALSAALEEMLSTSTGAASQQLAGWVRHFSAQAPDALQRSFS